LPGIISSHDAAIAEAPSESYVIELIRRIALHGTNSHLWHRSKLPLIVRSSVLGDHDPGAIAHDVAVRWPVSPRTPTKDAKSYQGSGLGLHEWFSTGLCDIEAHCS
jgi:hypothetical protein